jgi:hypothetical protein
VRTAAGRAAAGLDVPVDELADAGSTAR